jgi:hypothetical protein
MQRLILGNKDISTSLRMDGKYIDVAWPIYTSSIDIEYLVVGGGGSGGTSRREGGFNFNAAGGGGAAGSVSTGSFILQTVDAAPDPFTINVNVGIAGPKEEYNESESRVGLGNRGVVSYVGFNFYQALGAAGCGGGGYNTYDRPGLPIGGASGLNQSGDALTGSFANFYEGGYSGFYDNDAGGGAGASAVGGDGLQGQFDTNATGGAGGAGVNVTNWYWNSSLDVVGVIAGGGGGSAYDTPSPVAGVGSSGGGNGATGTNPAGNATSFGSGGGGSHKADSGAGADGLVVLRYENRFQINDSGDDVFQVGDYWYHSFYASASFTPQYTFERPEKIIIDM